MIFSVIKAWKSKFFHAFFKYISDMKIVAVEPIGISVDYAKELAEIYKAKGHEFVVYPDRKEDVSTLIERMKDAEAVIQKETDAFNKKIDEVIAAKEKEIMTV